MARRDLQSAFEGLRARLGNVAGSERADALRYAPGGGPRVHSRTVLVFATILALVAVGVAGYALGASRVVEIHSAELAGVAAGAQRGTDVGAHEGYASAFKPARERAYDAAYRDAYRAAYRDEFERADLREPRDIPVSGR